MTILNEHRVESSYISRLATPSDCAEIAIIYNQGIAGRLATFETEPRAAADIEKWFDGVHPIIVVTNGDDVIAFAATSTYRPRKCYQGIAEFSVYVSEAYRGHGAGKVAMQKLIEEAARAGFWKLVSRIFPENVSSLGLMRSLGFREVGIYEKHGKLEGHWKDVVIVERLLVE